MNAATTPAKEKAFDEALDEILNGRNRLKPPPHTKLSQLDWHSIYSGTSLAYIPNSKYVITRSNPTRSNKSVKYSFWQQENAHPDENNHSYHRMHNGELILHTHGCISYHAAWSDLDPITALGVLMNILGNSQG